MIDCHDVEMHHTPDTNLNAELSGNLLHPLKDEDIERLQFSAAYDGILLTRSAILQAAVKCDDLSQVVAQELAGKFPQTIVQECARRLCLQAGLSDILTKAALHRLQLKISETLSYQLADLRPGDVRTEVLIGWCSPKPTLNSSSVESVDTPTMDDGGRHGNVPP
ncbi:hypothetical protein, partial [Acetobacter pasteurianus]